MTAADSGGWMTEDIERIHAAAGHGGTRHGRQEKARLPEEKENVMKRRDVSAALLLCALLMICGCGRTESAWEEKELVETEVTVQAVWQVEDFAANAYVRVDNCKIKKGPGEEYETAGTLGLLEELRVTGRVKDSDGKEWYQIDAPRILEKEKLTEESYYILAEQVKL